LKAFLCSKKAISIKNEYCHLSSWPAVLPLFLSNRYESGPFSISIGMRGDESMRVNPYQTPPFLQKAGGGVSGYWTRYAAIPIRDVPHHAARLTTGACC
jgi:hypothetical protein